MYDPHVCVVLGAPTAPVFVGTLLWAQSSIIRKVSTPSKNGRVCTYSYKCETLGLMCSKLEA